MKIAKLIFLFCFGSICCFGQNEVKYCQKGLGFIGDNCYTLKKASKQSTTGTFERIQGFDDGQMWYGKGEFSEDKKKVIFSTYIFIRKKYNAMGDKLLKCDTSIIPTITFYIKGKRLVEYSFRTDKNGAKKRAKYIYEIDKD